MKTIAVCAVGIALMILALLQRPDSADDFRAFYRAGRLTAQRESVYAHPYAFPGKNADRVFLPYIRIPSYAMVLRPFASVPYAVARRLWIALSILALSACVWLLPEGKHRLAIALAFSLPVTYALMLGQDIGFVVLIVLSAARIFSSGRESSRREFLAGLVASLLGIKITYLPGAGLVLLAKSRWGTWGLIAGLAIQLAVSFAMEGAYWPARYLALLRSPFMDPEPRRMLNLRAVTASLSLPDGVFIAGAIAAFLLFWIACRRLSVADALLLALPLGLIASPHCYVYDGVVLIPLFATLAGQDCWEGMLALAGLTPLPYFMLMTEQPTLLLAGSTTVVLTTIAAAARFYRMRSTAAMVYSPAAA